MSLVHTAHTLTAEVATDPRTDNRAFCPEYAVAYAMRVLTGGRSRKAKGTAPKLVRDRRSGGSDGRPADLRPLDRFRVLPISETDHRRWQEARGSGTWREKLDSEAYDIAQDAAVLFFIARRKATDHRCNSCEGERKQCDVCRAEGDRFRIDTRGAIRFAVRDRRKEASRKSAKSRKRCSACRLEPAPCDACVSRIAEAKAQWARYNRPMGLAREVKDTLTSVAADTAFETAVSDLMPFRQINHSLRQETSRIFRFIASGSTVSEVADMLNVTQGYVSQFLASVRRSYTVESFRSSPVGTPEVKGTRIYGQGSGTTSATVGMLCDLLDAVLPHQGTAVKQAESKSAPPPFWTALKGWQLSMHLNVESGYHTFELREPIKPNVVPYVADYRTDDEANPPADETAFPTRPTTDPFTVGPEFAFAYGDVFGEDALLHTW